MYGIIPEQSEIELQQKPEKKAPETPGFEIIPAISIRSSKLVKVLPNGYRNMDMRLDDAVLKIAPEYGRMLLVDYDGLLRNRPQLDAIQKIKDLAKDSDYDIDLWVEAGIRQAEGAIDLFVAGADAAVISTSLIAGITELKKACELSGDLVLSIDCCGAGVVAAHRSLRGKDAAEIAAFAVSLGITRIALDSVVAESNDGSFCDLTSVQNALLKSSKGTHIYVHRAKSEFEKEREALQKSGFSGVIVELDEKDIPLR